MPSKPERIPVLFPPSGKMWQQQYHISDECLLANTPKSHAQAHMALLNQVTPTCTCMNQDYKLLSVRVCLCMCACTCLCVKPPPSDGCTIKCISYLWASTHHPHLTLQNVKPLLWAQLSSITLHDYPSVFFLPYLLPILLMYQYQKSIKVWPLICCYVVSVIELNVWSSTPVAKSIFTQNLLTVEMSPHPILFLAKSKMLVLLTYDKFPQVLQ